MYSPKISEELVPVLYRLAREKRIPMTRFVNQIIRHAVSENIHSGNSGTATLAVQFSAGREPRNAVA